MLDLTAAEDFAVSAVRATRVHVIHQYGTLPGKRRCDRPDVDAIEEIKDVKDGGAMARKQLKNAAQFDGWANDGNAASVGSPREFSQ